VPDSGCFVAVPSLDEVRSILRGSWLLMCGGSNTRVTVHTIMRQLAPQALEVRCAPLARMPAEAPVEVKTWPLAVASGTYSQCPVDTHRPCAPVGSSTRGASLFLAHGLGLLVP
jgi:hypothetical protein